MAAPSLNYTTLDVFTRTKYAGNPLAVVHLPSSTHLTQTQKQTIAREFNYSETVFLHLQGNDIVGGGGSGGRSAGSAGDETNGGIPSYKLDIFTTEEELPFAGHPTIGTACHVLKALSHGSNSNSGSSCGGDAVEARFEIKAGVLELEYKDGVARAAIPHNVHIHSAHDLTADKILAWQSSGLAAFFNKGAEGVKQQGLKFEVVSPVRGMTFVMVELGSLEALGKVKTAGTRLSARLDEGWEGTLMVMFYVRVEEEKGDGVIRLRTRMVEGSFEDPATGSASVGLAALLALKEGRDGRTKFEMVQAVEMGRRSEIGVEIVAEQGKVKTAELVGSAVEVMEGRVFYE